MTRYAKSYVLGCCLLCLLFKSYSQRSYRPKLAEFAVEKLSDHRTPYTGEGMLNGNSQSDGDLLLKAKLAIPLVISDQRLIGLQLKHNQHRFIFNHADYEGNSDIFGELENRTFYNSAVRFLYREQLTPFKSLTFLGSLGINNDQFKITPEALNASASISYSVQRSSTEEIGFGLVASQTLGRFRALPLFTYENHFAPRWVIDLALPKSAALRYIVDNRTFVTAKAEFKSNRYNLTDPLVGQYTDLTIRKLDLQWNLAFEREIHDWLWFSLEAGYNRNLLYTIVERGEATRDALIRLRPRDAAYMKASIFIVPPRKLFNR
ncbi:MAG: DUF6268 family outer membrane beta-barrel protein [Bacteroidota bacterium]